MITIKVESIGGRVLTLQLFYVILWVINSQNQSTVNNIQRNEVLLTHQQLHWKARHNDFHSTQIVNILNETIKTFLFFRSPVFSY